MVKGGFYIKKLFPLLLSLIFICSVPTTVFASSNDSPNNDLQILASMQERESSALQYISEHKEEILAEIETNKMNLLFHRIMFLTADFDI